MQTRYTMHTCQNSRNSELYDPKNCNTLICKHNRVLHCDILREHFQRICSLHIGNNMTDVFL